MFPKAYQIHNNHPHSPQAKRQHLQVETRTRFGHRHKLAISSHVLSRCLLLRFLVRAYTITHFIRHVHTQRSAFPPLQPLSTAGATRQPRCAIRCAPPTAPCCTAFPERDRSDLRESSCAGPRPLVSTDPTLTWLGLGISSLPGLDSYSAIANASGNEENG